MASSDEAMRERVAREISQIRAKFSSAKALKDYDTRKYICKLMYAFLLGFPVDFGFIEASQLIASPVRVNKVVGHLFLTLMLNISDDFTELISATLASDIESGNVVNASLALNTVAVLGSATMAEAMAPVIMQILVTGTTPAGETVKTIVRKKAALAFLQLYRTAPSAVALGDDDVAKLTSLLNVRNVGFLTAILSLFHEFAVNPPTANAIPAMIEHRTRIVHLLGKIRRGEVAEDHMYLGSVPCPWLQIKLLRLLRLMPPPSETSDPAEYQNVVKCLTSIFLNLDVGKGLHHVQIQLAIFREALAVATAVSLDPVYLVGGEDGEAPEAPPSPVYSPQSLTSPMLDLSSPAVKQASVEGMIKEADPSPLPAQYQTRARSSSAARLAARRRTMSQPAHSALGRVARTLQSEQPNLRYFGLSSLAELATDERLRGRLSHFIPIIGNHMIVEEDHATCSRALMLLFNLAHDIDSAQKVINLAFSLIERERGTPSELLRTLNLVVAVLAERFSATEEDYVSTTIRLVSRIGDAATNDVTYRLCNVVNGGAPSTQAHAARLALDLLAGSPTEALVRAAVFILGEFGYHLIKDGTTRPTDVIRAFSAAADNFEGSDPSVCAALVPAAAKAVVWTHKHQPAATSEAAAAAIALISRFSTSADAELQQRALEYGALLRDPALAATVLAALPPPAQRGASTLEKKLDAATGASTAPQVSTGPPIVHPRGGALFMGAPSGLLFDSPVLQIGCKSRLDGENCILEVFLGNKTGSAFECESVALISSVASLDAESAELLSQRPVVLPAKAQTVLRLRAPLTTVCAHAARVAAEVSGRPDVEPVHMPQALGEALIRGVSRLRVVCSAQDIAVSVLLPAVAPAIGVPLPPQVADTLPFAQSWESLAPGEVIAIVPVRNPVPLDILRNALLTNSLHAPLSVDPSGTSIVSLGAIVNTSGPRPVMCLARLQIAHVQKLARVVVRTNDASVSYGVAAAILGAVAALCENE